MSVQLEVDNDVWTALGGRALVRIRETHVRDHLAPLITAGAAGAVKLDLALRALAPVPGNGQAQPGLLSPDVSWALLHDLVRDAVFYEGATTLKRKWVNDKLNRLESLRLVRREFVPGGRSRLIVLRDDGSGLELDDPSGGEGATYVSTFGTVVRCGWLARWGNPEVAAYLAAMTAERFARSDPVFAEIFGLERNPLGSGLWYRPASWFADEAGRRPRHHIRYPFSAATVREGLRSLASQSLILTEALHFNHLTGKRFPEPRKRVLYHNHFHDVRLGKLTQTLIPGKSDSRIVGYWDTRTSDATRNSELRP